MLSTILSNCFVHFLFAFMLALNHALNLCKKMLEVILT
jgi:hypothetical protein